MPMMDAEDTMQGETGAMADKPTNDSPQGGDDEATSVFLPKTAFGDRPPKVGDSLKDFKIVDIDPETGDVEAKCTYDEAEHQDMGDSYEEGFDRAMPPEE